MGGGKKTTAAALARARVRKKELWMQYYMKKKGEGWLGMESGILIEG